MNVRRTPKVEPFTCPISSLEYGDAFRLKETYFDELLDDEISPNETCIRVFLDGMFLHHGKDYLITAVSVEDGSLFSLPESLEVIPLEAEINILGDVQL